MFPFAAALGPWFFSCYDGHKGGNGNMYHKDVRISPKIESTGRVQGHHFVALDREFPNALSRFKTEIRQHP